MSLPRLLAVPTSTSPRMETWDTLDMARDILDLSTLLRFVSHSCGHSDNDASDVLIKVQEQIVNILFCLSAANGHAQIPHRKTWCKALYWQAYNSRRVQTLVRRCFQTCRSRCKKARLFRTTYPLLPLVQ